MPPLAGSVGGLRVEVGFVSASWTIPTFALAIVGAFLSARIRGKAGVSTTLLLLLPALYASVLHTLFVGSVRYRLMAMPMLEVLAAFALVALFDRSRSRRPAGARGIDD